MKTQNLDPKNHSDRRKVNNDLNESQRWPIRSEQGEGDHREACEHLNLIRNALAHGNPEDRDRVQKILDDEQKLRSTLQKAFDCLLPS